MVDLLLYIVIPTVIFVVGCGIGFGIGKVKYSQSAPPPNYLGGPLKRED